MKRVALVLAFLTGISQAAGWTLADFTAAAAASGRPIKMTPEVFAALEPRRALVQEKLNAYMSARFKAVDPAILAAFAEVPREYFHFHYQRREWFADRAYEIPAKPYAVGWGSALSDYEGQVYMTQLARPSPKHTVLEIGTGSGYQIALLSRLVQSAYSIEIVKPLGEAVEKIFAPLGYTNVHTRTGDGYFGWPEVPGGFDTIMVTCAAQYVPPALLEQLKPGGRLIIPIGQPFKHGQFLYVYRKDRQGKVHSTKIVGMYFVPMTGAMQKTPDPAAASATVSH
jgi:protein-L-isoaspartate(D-aspartate) O-methyltransferase